MIANRALFLGFTVSTLLIVGATWCVAQGQGVIQSDAPEVEEFYVGEALLERTLLVTPVRTDSRVERFELRVPHSDSPRQDLQLVLSDTAEGGPPSEETARVVWRNSYMRNAFISTLSGPALVYSERNSGARTVATTIASSTERSIAYWMGTTDSDGTESWRFRTFGHLMASNPRAPEDAAPVHLSDLYTPQLFSWGGRLYLAGGAANLFGHCLYGEELVEGAARCSRVVWIVNLDESHSVHGENSGRCGLEPGPEAEQDLSSSPTLCVHSEGKVAVTGRNPRFVVEGASVLLSVRSPSKEGELHTPLVFYRSSDLSEWVLDEHLSNRVTAPPNYSIAEIDGVIYVARPSEDSVPFLQMYSFVDGEWQEDLALSMLELAVHSSKQCIWIFSAGEVGGAGQMQIIFQHPDGTLDQTWR